MRDTFITECVSCADLFVALGANGETETCLPPPLPHPLFFGWGGGIYLFYYYLGRGTRVGGGGRGQNESSSRVLNATTATDRETATTNLSLTYCILRPDNRTGSSRVHEPPQSRRL